MNTSQATHSKLILPSSLFCIGWCFILIALSAVRSTEIKSGLIQNIFKRLTDDAALAFSFARIAEGVVTNVVLIEGLIFTAAYAILVYRVLKHDKRNANPIIP